MISSIELIILMSQFVAKLFNQLLLLIVDQLIEFNINVILRYV